MPKGNQFGFQNFAATLPDLRFLCVFAIDQLQGFKAQTCKLSFQRYPCLHGLLNSIDKVIALLFGQSCDDFSAAQTVCFDSGCHVYRS